MQPDQTTELTLRFAAGISPWWLLLLLPAVGAAGWLLYRRDVRSVAARGTGALAGLRVFVLCALVFLAFRPTLVHRTLLTFPGRILTVLDNSRSMEATDSRMPAEDALRLHRTLMGAEGQSAAYHLTAQALADVKMLLADFQAFSRAGDRSRDAFWQRAERMRSDIEDRFQRAGELLEVAPDLPKPAAQKLRDPAARLSELHQGLEVFFTGSHHPGAKAFGRFYNQTDDLIDNLLMAQAALDRAALAGRGGAETLAEKVRWVRGRSRLDLLDRALRENLLEMEELSGEQGLQFAPLMGDPAVPAGEFAGAEIEAKDGPTDIVGRLQELLETPSEFPLSALILAGDGRHLGPGAIESLEQSFSRRGIPVFSARLGSVREPLDLAVLDRRVPPVGVVGQTARVRIHIKAALDQAREVQVSLLRGEETVNTKKVTVGSGPPEELEQEVTLRFTPAQKGVHRYTVRFASLPGEAFPVRNNSADFVMDVREAKIKVLLVDWKPRWETRFASNILQRLDYVELNSIIVVARKDARLQRGVEEGTWPEDRSALAIYDLVVLGDLPPGVLTDSEWEGLAEFVSEEGKSLCIIGAGGETGVLPEVAERILPAATGEPKTASSLRDLGVTPAGRYHPATIVLSDALQPVVPATDLLRPDACSLLADASGGDALISCRFAGRGRVMSLSHPGLWKLLNPTLLQAHAQLFVQMVNWAVVAGAPDEDNAPRLALDAHSFDAGRGLQVWGLRAGESDVVLAQTGGETFAKTPLAATGGAHLQRAVFEELDPGRYRFVLEDQPEVAAGPVFGLQEHPELHYLAQDRRFLDRVAQATGGESRSFVDIKQFFASIPVTERTETHERRWRLWDMTLVLALAAILLTVEWVWRKVVGLV